MKRALLGFIFILLFTGISIAQNSAIRLSGIVLMLDSLKPVSNSHVYINGSSSGVRADEMGLFSLEANRLDTIVFSAIGYKKTYYVIPDTLKGQSYSIIQRMPHDTITLSTVEVVSWPTIEQFNASFTREHGYDQKFSIGQYNANPNMMHTRMDLHDMDGADNFRLEGMRYQNRYSYVYENAHIPIGNVLNPTNWNHLFNNWSSTSKAPR